MALVTVHRSPSPSASPDTASSDYIDGTDESTDASLRSPTRSRAFSESYFTVKGAALILPYSECQHSVKKGPQGDIQIHLQAMFHLLRPQDTIKLAVRLESAYVKHVRYMVVVATYDRLDTEECAVLGIDIKEEEIETSPVAEASPVEPPDPGGSTSSDPAVTSTSAAVTNKIVKSASIGLILPVYCHCEVTLDGDGGIRFTSRSTQDSTTTNHIFRPVSVQAMWSAFQCLTRACKEAVQYSYSVPGLNHSWIPYFTFQQSKHMDQQAIYEWNRMEDLESVREDLNALEDLSTEKAQVEKLIKVKLKEVMMTEDLEEVTSKTLRLKLEASLNRPLREYRMYIDEQMIKILRQMDAPSRVFDFLYLGSEWNASNLPELKNNGVTHILNVTREIDNFFPGMFEYKNVREYDVETSQLMPHWNGTYNFIQQAWKTGGKVLVHCKMGVSRSASTVIAFAMKAFDLSLDEALQRVKDRRGRIKPNKGFMTQLVTYEGIIHASKQRHNKKWLSQSAESINHSMRRYNPLLGDDLLLHYGGGGRGYDDDDGGDGDVDSDDNDDMTRDYDGEVKCRPKSWSPASSGAHALLTGTEKSGSPESDRDTLVDAGECDDDVVFEPAAGGAVHCDMVDLRSDFVQFLCSEHIGLEHTDRSIDSDECVESPVNYKKRRKRKHDDASASIVLTSSRALTSTGTDDSIDSSGSSDISMSSGETDSTYNGGSDGSCSSVDVCNTADKPADVHSASPVSAVLNDTAGITQQSEVTTSASQSESVKVPQLESEVATIAPSEVPEVESSVVPESASLASAQLPSSELQQSAAMLHIEGACESETEDADTADVRVPAHHDADDSDRPPAPPVHRSLTRHNWGYYDVTMLCMMTSSSVCDISDEALVIDATTSAADDINSTSDVSNKTGDISSERVGTSYVYRHPDEQVEAAMEHVSNDKKIAVMILKSSRSSRHRHMHKHRTSKHARLSDAVHEPLTMTRSMPTPQLASLRSDRSWIKQRSIELLEDKTTADDSPVAAHHQPQPADGDDANGDNNCEGAVDNYNATGNDDDDGGEEHHHAPPGTVKQQTADIELRIKGRHLSGESPVGDGAAMSPPRSPPSSSETSPDAATAADSVTDDRGAADANTSADPTDTAAVTQGASDKDARGGRLSIYLDDDVELPRGIVQRTKQELEQRARYEPMSSTPMVGRVQRSSSLKLRSPSSDLQMRSDDSTDGSDSMTPADRRGSVPIICPLCQCKRSKCRHSERRKTCQPVIRVTDSDGVNSLTPDAEPRAQSEPKDIPATGSVKQQLQFGDADNASDASGAPVGAAGAAEDMSVLYQVGSEVVQLEEGNVKRKTEGYESLQPETKPRKPSVAQDISPTHTYMPESAQPTPVQVHTSSDPAYTPARASSPPDLSVSSASTASIASTLVNVVASSLSLQLQSGTACPTAAGTACASTSSVRPVSPFVQQEGIEVRVGNVRRRQKSFRNSLSKSPADKESAKLDPSGVDNSEKTADNDTVICSDTSDKCDTNKVNGDNAKAPDKCKNNSDNSHSDNSEKDASFLIGSGSEEIKDVKSLVGLFNKISSPEPARRVHRKKKGVELKRSHTWSSRGQREGSRGASAFYRRSSASDVEDQGISDLESSLDSVLRSPSSIANTSNTDTSTSSGSDVTTSNSVSTGESDVSIASSSGNDSLSDASNSVREPQRKTLTSTKSAPVITRSVMNHHTVSTTRPLSSEGIRQSARHSSVSSDTRTADARRVVTAAGINNVVEIPTQREPATADNKKRKPKQTTGRSHPLTRLARTDAAAGTASSLSST